MARQDTHLTQTGAEVQALLDKVEGIEAGAQVNDIEKIKVNGTEQAVVDKEVDITVPTSLSNLSDDTTHRVVTDDEKSAWNAKADVTDIPDVSSFITKSVNDLTYYYLKTETYTKDEVAALIRAIQQFHYEIYASTAAVTNPQGNVLYLIGPTGSGEDRYEEYVYSNNTWVKIGDTSIDLSGFVTISDLNTALSAYTTSADLSDLLDAKQDVINDLDDIRDGAAAGATAYQKPQYGIPESDLDYSVTEKMREKVQFNSLPSSDITSVEDLEDYGFSRNKLISLADGTASALIFNELTEYGLGLSDYRQTECTITKCTKIIGDVSDQCELSFILNGYEYAITADYNTRVATVTVTAVQDITNKADKVSGATNGHLAALDSNGNLTDSGKSASDFATAAQGAKADSSYQKPATGIPASDLAAGVIPTVPTDVVKYSQQSLTDGQKTQARTNIGAGTYSKPSGGIPASDIAPGVIPAGVTVDQTYDATSQNAQSGVAMAGALAGKQDTINDLQTIRSGASAGATAYQKPQTGIPASDLAAGVIPTVPTDVVKYSSQSLTDAQKTQARTNIGAGTYSKPSDGIPASDLASGVIPEVPTISTDITADATSDTKTASPKAVKTFVEGKGYGTYSKPSGGIPAADLASGVIPTVPTISTDIASDATSDTKTASPKAVKTFVENKGYGTYSKPSGGIPAADIAAGVIPTVPTISTDIAADKSSTTKTAAPSAVYNEVHPAFGSSQPAGGMLPNVLYKLGTLTGNVTISFAAATDATIENEYKFTFTAGSTAPTITWPAAITGWAGNCVEDGAPVITGGNYYEVSVMDGIALIAEVEA